MSVVIAIDGPAAAGKGTLARMLARRFGFALLETGLLYRAVGHKLLQDGESPENVEAATRAATSLRPEDLADPHLRSDEAAQAASKVSAIPGVRAALLAFQRDFAAHPPPPAKGAVLDGRDIGTVVCPEATVKLFISARVEIRAQRRLKELQERGIKAIPARVLQEMRERDERDSSRSDAPLRPAPDAHRLDTSDLDVGEAFAACLTHLAAKLAESEGFSAGRAP